MKKRIIISIICLFSLQCEKGWLREILNPTVEGCNIPTACNYNPDVNKFDNSCDFATCIDCLGIPHGIAYMDSCGTCDAVEANDCEQDCDGKWGGVKTFDCNDACGGEAKLDNCGTCDAVEDNDCVIDCTGKYGGDDGIANSGDEAELDQCGVCNGNGSTCKDCNGDIGGPNGILYDGDEAYFDGCGWCVGGNTGLDACKFNCAGEDSGIDDTIDWLSVINLCGNCVDVIDFNGDGGINIIDIQDAIWGAGDSSCIQGCDGNWSNEGNAPVNDECEVCGGNNSTCSDCNGVANGSAFIDPHYGEDNCTVNECVSGNTDFIPCEQDCNGEWGGSAEIDLCGVCGGNGDCEGVNCSDNSSDYCQDLEVLQDFIDLNPSLSLARPPLGIGDQIWENGRLTSLVLSFSQLTDVPGTIDDLTALSELYLIGNQLNSLPESICNFLDGCIINVGNNQLCEDFHFDCITDWGGQDQSDCEGSIDCVDIDGNIYKTVQIGDQLWMAENLKVTHYNNGDEITHIANNDDWGSNDEGQYGIYDNDPANADIYGKLYNFAVVNDDRDVCPEGWHVPSDDEWTILTDYLGGESVAGGKMKEAGLDHWNYYNDEITEEATNESGFTALPAGYRKVSNDGYIYMGNHGYFWSSSEYDSNYAWFRSLSYYNSNLTRSHYGYERGGLSIRCLGD